VNFALRLETRPDEFGRQVSFGLTDADAVEGRVLDWLAPGEYRFEVALAGPQGGDVDWDLTVEQPGVATTGAPVPFVVESQHQDVVGPIAIDGRVRVTFETLATRYYLGNSSTSLHQVWVSDERGRGRRLVVNASETAPAVFAQEFDYDGLAYFYVEGTLAPWRLTVEPV
jgi:hypothetical protein